MARRWGNHFFILPSCTWAEPVIAQQACEAMAGAEARPWPHSPPWQAAEDGWLRLGIKGLPGGRAETDLGSMETQRRAVSLLLLLLGLVMPVATAQILSYQEAVLRAVDSFNQRSFHDNLFRLLDLESQPPEVSWGQHNALLLQPASGHFLCSCYALPACLSQEGFLELSFLLA